MRRSADYTHIGGPGRGFPTTEWTQVIGLSLGQSIQDDFVNRYWKPIYCYLRSKRYGNEQAKDLTQGFFTEIILDSGLFKHLDRRKGKFRSLLLTALNHYIIDVARHEKRKKRCPVAMVSLDESLPLPSEALTNPEQAFDYAWASEVLDRVLAGLRTECKSEGLSTHWEMFHARVLRPIMEGIEVPSLAEVCRQFGVPTEIKASNMIGTIKRRFRRALKRTMHKCVGPDTDEDQEIFRLMAVLTQARG